MPFLWTAQTLWQSKWQKWISKKYEYAWCGTKMRAPNFRNPFSRKIVMKTLEWINCMTRRLWSKILCPSLFLRSTVLSPSLFSLEQIQFSLRPKRPWNRPFRIGPSQGLLYFRDVKCKAHNLYNSNIYKSGITHHRILNKKSWVYMDEQSSRDCEV